jgi:hypothetical protein
MPQSNYALNSLVQRAKSARSKPIFLAIAVLSAFLILMWAINRLDQRVYLDLVGENVSSVDASEVRANFGEWGMSWGWLTPSSGSRDLDLHFPAPKFARVYWMAKGESIARWVQVEGAPLPNSRDDRIDFVVEIDPECGRARAFWIKRYDGPEPNRRIQTAPRDCTIYSDEPWTNQVWSK